MSAVDEVIEKVSGMTVLENLIVAQHNVLMRASGYTAAGLFGLKSYRDAERDAIDLARSWLDRLGLTAQADWEAGNLPYGSQRRLEIDETVLESKQIRLLLRGPHPGVVVLVQLLKFDPDRYFHRVEAP